jgi:hypothetical protein
MPATIRSARAMEMATRWMGYEPERMTQRAAHAATRNKSTQVCWLTTRRISTGGAGERRRTYLRRPHHSPSIPDDPPTMPTHHAAVDDSNRRLEVSAPEDGPTGRTNASRPYRANQTAQIRYIWTGDVGEAVLGRESQRRGRWSRSRMDRTHLGSTTAAPAATCLIWTRAQPIEPRLTILGNCSSSATRNHTDSPRRTTIQLV